MSKPSPSASASALCLACSGCIPAREQPSAFRTPCCARPICAACAAANPRLLRYDPCLACLAGVRAVAVAAQGRLPPPPTTTNLDGALRDADVFVLGDEEEENADDADADDEVRGAADADPPRTPPPAYRETDAPVPTEPTAPDAPAERPGTHRIQREDTLRGLALKYAVDGRALCRLNGLPPSTLSTTPHLLHTRAVLLLPPHIQAPVLLSKDAPGASSSSGRAQCAAARLQRATHEADPRVARAYVALASSPSRSPSPSPPPPGEKEKQGNDSADSPADRAVRAYRADAAWEASERAAGRGPPSSSSSRATPAPALWARRR